MNLKKVYILKLLSNIAIFKNFLICKIGVLFAQKIEYNIISIKKQFMMINYLVVYIFYYSIVRSNYDI